LIEAGTNAATAESAPEALELAAVVEPAAAELLAEVDEDELLLLPHPAITTTLSSGITMETQLFGVRIALLLHSDFTQKTWPGYATSPSLARTSNRAPIRPQGGASLGPMQVRIRLFAGLRERAGTDEVKLELPEGARVSDALERLHELTAGTPVVMAVNQEYAGADEALSAGDELALIPPVSGGSVGVAHVRVTKAPLKLDALVELVRDPRAGAVVTFMGVTRDVPSLQYEAYAEMARAKLAEVVTAAIEAHGLCAAAAEHRIGEVPLSETSVAIAVSAPHRAAAFAGARQIIDQIKERAPIWKKEEDEWVSGSRPSTAPPSRPR
jgi:molybdopterin synthase catalytic subunit